jgi:carbonic anhydrase
MTLIRFAAIAALLCPLGCWSRQWTDISLRHYTRPEDKAGDAYLDANDRLYRNTVQPTFSPTASTVPTLSPTRTLAPSTQPPSSNPTSPAPTLTPDPYPPIPEPESAAPWYFNYNTSSEAAYGPGYPSVVLGGDGTLQMAYKNNWWSGVFTDPNSDWIEFTNNGFGPWRGTLDNRDPLRNQCDRVGMQSPIDLYETGASCDETHEVRSRPGDFRVSGDRVLRQILPNKLRLKYARRNCRDKDDRGEYDPLCAEPDPPHADFPNGWGGFADVLHIDFKFPSEHWIEGESFDGEMQIFHLHEGRRRLPVQVSLIRAIEYGYNYYLEEAIVALEYQYKLDRAKCAVRQRRERQLISEAHNILGEQDEGIAFDENVTAPAVDYETWADYSTDMDHPDFKEYSEEMERKLQMGVWDPYHDKLFPSIWFWRYDGSLTEPPCGEWVSWFISDKPMVIGFEQLERLKNILFTHVDESCQETSAHYGHSVARPIQETGSRPVWKCTPDDWGPDL